MTLKELRIWHWQQMQKHTGLPQGVFHLSAVNAITEAIGGSAEQDIADAKALNDLVPLASVTAARKGLCPICQGNNGDMPCAYPSEHIKGCLKYSGAIDPSDTAC